MTAYEPQDGRGDIPASIVANVKGLPPARGRLARYLVWRAEVSADLDRLEAGRTKLQNEIMRSEAAEAQAAAAFEAEAATLAERVASGVEVLFSALARKPKSIVQDTKLARAALARLEAEIQSKQALLTCIEGRWGEFHNSALCETGQEIGKAYASTLATLRDQMAQLEGLDILCGAGRGGRLVASVPAFRSAGHKIAGDHAIVALPAEIGAAVGAWRALARIWSSDPRAPAAKHLRFGKHDPKAVDQTPYESLSPLERRARDIEYAHGGTPNDPMLG
jgi:hypothetical protein